jgi:uncharacterized repeat protein (TIGR01451 family)
MQWMLVLAAVLGGTAAQAALTINSVDLATRVGRGQTVPVTVSFTRSSGSGGETFTINSSDRLEIVSVPGNCTVAGAVGTSQTVTCTGVDPGNIGSSGSLVVQARGLSLGGGNVSAQQGVGSSATDSFSVVSGADLTVAKTMAPSATVTNGQNVTFTLTPALAGDSVPAGGSVTVTDQLPGTAAEFTLSAFSAPGYSCNTLANANSTRVLTCTINGAVASLPPITLQGRPTTSGAGGLVNNASITADGTNYIDTNATNNTASVAFSVNPGSDPRPTGGFPATVITGTPQTLTISFVNGGPQTVSGGQVRAAIPAGFTIGTLPSGCSLGGAGTVNGVSGTLVTCTSGTVTSGSTQSFLLPLTAPATAAAGNFGVEVITGTGGSLPGGLTDSDLTNNRTLVPFNVVPPYADLSTTKTKTPTPVGANGLITSNIDVRNNGVAAAVFSVSGGATPLRVIDDTDNLEAFESASAGWTCSDGGADSAGVGRRRITCVRTLAGTLAVGATLPLILTTRASPSLVGQVTLTNEACTGATALTRLGLTSADGPQPPDGNQVNGADCATANVTGTDVVSGAAQASVVKESSNDGASWVDPVAGAPTVASTQNSMFWRMTITTPSLGVNGLQQTIPTLRLADTLPAILNAGSAGSPSYQTPSPTVTTSVPAGAATTATCTPPAAGASALNCTFTGVTPGTTIEVVVEVRRPFEQGTFTNTATLSSPNAILTAAVGGQLSDQAALTVQGRNDPSVTSKTVTPPNSLTEPRVGQVVSYTIVARNLGPNRVNGPMTVSDTLDPTRFRVLTATAAGGGSAPAMTCSFVVATGAVTCATGASTSVARYDFYTVTITALLLKPVTLPPSGTVSSFTNTATVSQDPAQNCELRTTAPASTACNDANSTSNNSGSVSVDIKVPLIDVLQKKSRVLPSGQANFTLGDPLRYRLRAQNNGPSRAEDIVVTDRLNVPAGYSLTLIGVAAVNSVGAESGYTRDDTKSSATVSCTQAGANADVVCQLGAAAVNFLNPASEVNFDLTFSLVGPAAVVSIGNTARICADESTGYESSGSCVFTPAAAAGNNIASVNDVVFPRTDLTVNKARITASPVTVNQPTLYRLTVQNLGPNDTTQVRVTDVLPLNWEWVNTGAFVPTATAGGFAGLSISNTSCSASPAAVTAAGQQQAISCVLTGSFPAGADASNTIALNLYARPKPEFYTGPYLTDLTNTATVSPGLDSGGGALSLDRNPANDQSNALTQVRTLNLSGTVFEDRDRTPGNAGVPQAPGAEPRLSGVTITLSGTDIHGDPVLRTAVTDASGNYTFANLPPSNGAGYTLTQTQPGTHVNGPDAPPTSGVNAPSAGGTYAGGGSSGNSSFTGVVLGATDGTRYNFPEVRRPSLSGFVYVDRNDNGSFNPGAAASNDPPVAGATVRLLNASTGAIVTTTTTAADGSYSFAALDPLIPYVLEQPLPTTPSSLSNGPINPGLIGAAPCASGCLAQPNTPAAGTDRIAAIDLSTGLDGTQFNFGEREVARLSGTVFEDRLRVGADGGSPQAPAQEPRIAGVVITLTGTALNGTVINRTVTTDANGEYVFDNLPPSNPAGYTLTQTQPAGFNNSPVNPSGASSGGTYANAALAGNSSYSAVVVSPGASATRYDFPELRRPSLSGFVYSDRNGNDRRDALGDAPIAGATVRLLNAATGALVSTTTTAADGSYRFSNLDPLITYTLEEPLPASPVGLTNGAVNPGVVGGAACSSGCTAQPNNPAPNTDRIASINLSTGQDGTEFNFGEREFGSISGTVFEDRERSGAEAGTPQTPALEPRLAGIVVTLTGTDLFGNPVSRTTTTGPDGSYRFDDLFASDARGYSVTQQQPGTHVNGPASPPPGSAGGTYSAGGSAGNSVHSGIVLVGGVNASGYDFPEVRKPTLSGTVYLDTNGNSQRDAADTGIANATVRLLDATTGAVIATTLTGADGSYSFPDLDPLRRYTLEEPLPSVPAGLFNGPINPGLIGGAFCASGCTEQPNSPAPNTDRIAGIDLSKGSDGTGFSFGERLQTFIGGSVYIDRNANGQLDPPALDGRLPGVTLTLYPGTSCTGTPLTTTTTDANGVYTFGPLPAGLTYTICQTQPQGFNDGSVNPGSGGSSTGPNSITITNLPGGGSTNNHFGERGASLAGLIWLDANNDGTRQGSEAPIPGVVVTLTGNDAAGRPVNRTATTDATGRYRFDDLMAAGPGGYTVTEQSAQPVVAGNATLDGRTVAGSVGGTASAVNSGPSRVSGIALAAGANAVNYDFGEIPPSTLSGTVFIDVDNNGLQTLPGDAGLSGITLLITGTDDTGAAVSRTVVTDANGNYSLPDLRPGTYSVVEPTQPPGTGNGITTAGTTGGNASPVGSTPSRIDAIVLPAPGSRSTGNNFAEVPIDAALGGRVWFDANNNGVVDPTEAGIPNVTINLTGTDNAGNTINRSLTTDANGDFRFGGLPPGTYQLREPTQPTGTLNGVTLGGSGGGVATGVGSTPSAITGIALATSQQILDHRFGEIPPASLAGRVYADNNDNGVPDPAQGSTPAEAGIGGVTVVLTGTDDQGNPVSLTTTTDVDGRYRFDDLRPGRYTVTEPTQPAGTINGRTTAGSAGGAATPVSTTPSAIAEIRLAPGQAAVDNNFGEIGFSPDLRVGKRVEPTPLTANNPGTYFISVRNSGNLVSTGVYTVTDQLPAGIVLSAAPSGTGWACTGAANDTRFTCTSSVPLAAGQVLADAIRVPVSVLPAAAGASPVSNAVMVEGGGEIAARGPTPQERAAVDGDVSRLPLCTAAIEHNACRLPTLVQQSASLSGTVWYDVGGSSRLLDAGDRRLPGWIVEVVDPATGAVVATTTTAADGSYRVNNLVPGVELAVRFRDPSSRVVFGYPVNGETAAGSSGASCTGVGAQPSSCADAGANPRLRVVLTPGANLAQQSLPVDPSGVVYDSGTRQPVPGSIVSLSPVGACVGWDPASQLVGGSSGGYTLSGGSASMQVGADGFYQFLFAPSAPARCQFQLTVTPPPGYSVPSTAIPASTTVLDPPGGPAATFQVQPQAGPPTGAVGAGTTYHFSFFGGSAGANIIHNHIPLDPQQPTSVSLSKTGDKAVAEVGDSIRYRITVSASSGGLPRQTTVVDRLPAGFTFIPGTAMVDGVTVANPAGGVGPALAFNLGPMGPSRQLVLQYRVRVGVGAAQGDGTNRALAHSCGVPGGCVDANLQPLRGSVSTNEGRHTVRIQGGVFAPEACVLGKVFVDCNNNHIQDREELGVPGVRLVMSEGTTLISDSEGKYSVCGVRPMSHVLRVDEATLPRGSRLTTSSNRNLGDAGSLWLDLKNGELHRADFIIGSCSNTVLEQTKARRAQGEVRAPEVEKKTGPALRFDSKAHGKTPFSSPDQGTDGANQLAPKARRPASPSSAADERHTPTPDLPMNRPPPPGRRTDQAPAAQPASSGASDAAR